MSKMWYHSLSNASDAELQAELKKRVEKRARDAADPKPKRPAKPKPPAPPLESLSETVSLNSWSSTYTVSLRQLIDEAGDARPEDVAIVVETEWSSNYGDDRNLDVTMVKTRPDPDFSAKLADYLRRKEEYEAKMLAYPDALQRWKEELRDWKRRNPNG